MLSSRMQAAVIIGRIKRSVVGLHLAMSKLPLHIEVNDTKLGFLIARLNRLEVQIISKVSYFLNEVMKAMIATRFFFIRTEFIRTSTSVLLKI